MEKFDNSEEWVEFLKNTQKLLFEDKKPVPIMVANHIIELKDGSLAINKDDGTAVSLSMGNEGLSVTFYDLVGNDQIKVTDSRDIQITEGFVSSLMYLISLCKKRSMVKSMDKDKDIDDFGKMYG